MIRLAKYVENELYENSVLFAEAEARLMASCSYIDFVLKDKTLTNLNKEEKQYINQVRKSYKILQKLSKKISKEIQKYKETYCDFFV